MFGKDDREKRQAKEILRKYHKQLMSTKLFSMQTKDLGHKCTVPIFAKSALKTWISTRVWEGYLQLVTIVKKEVNIHTYEDMVSDYAVGGGGIHQVRC